MLGAWRWVQALVLEVHSDEGAQFGGGIGGSCCTRGSRHKSRPRRNGENSAVRDFEGSEVADSMEASSEGRAGSPQRRARSSLGPWTPVAGRFCSTTRRGCRAVDARSPIGHARCESSRECPRVGEVVLSCGFHSDGVVKDIAAFNCRKRGEGH